MHIFAPYSNARPTSRTLRIDAPNISVLFQFCFENIFAMSLIRHRPPKELSSTLPTKGDMYVAPAFAASIACDGENISVTLTRIINFFNCLQTASPSGVQGT